MPKKTIPLTDLVRLFRQMQPCEWRDGRLHGQISVANAAMASFLQDLLDEDSADDYPCVIEQGDPENLAIGNILQLSFGAPKTSIGIVVESVDALLRNREIAAGTVDRDWYVFDGDVASWEADSG